jgi:hypothetical protein
VSDDAAPARRDWRDRRQQVRLIAALVVIAAFVALAALAIAASRSSFSLGLPAAAHEAETSTPPPTVVPTVPAPGLGYVAAPVVTSPVVEGVSSQSEAPAPSAGSAPPSVAQPPARPPASTGAACPALGLLPPEDVGGLQSLVALIPLFGPFSPEAFAMLPAFEPGFGALGPLFPVFGRGLDAAAPLLTPLTPVVQQLEEAGFSTVGPFYTPMRAQVLAAEKQLATQLAPVVAALATAPGSECLVDLEGVLASLAS